MFAARGAENLAVWAGSPSDSDMTFMISFRGRCNPTGVQARCGSEGRMTFAACASRSKVDRVGGGLLRLHVRVNMVSERDVVAVVAQRVLRLADQLRGVEREVGRCAAVAGPVAGQVAATHGGHGTAIEFFGD